MIRNASSLFLLASLIGLAFTACALLRIRRPAFFGPFHFFAAWPAGELALHHIAWQAVATVLFGLSGAFSQWPGQLGAGLTLVSWIGLAIAWRRALPTGDLMEQALRAILGSDYRDAIPETRRSLLRANAPPAEIARPFSMKRPGVRIERNIAYGQAGRRQTLDVYYPESPGQGRPVLFQVHGGAWVIGQKEHQALPLMYHMAERGWVCVAANYRLSPKVRFPEHLIDLKRALAWTRQNISRFGGDPEFVAATGGSAGGHLSSLLALTAGEGALQPGFEGIDTRVAACVPFYGIYDFLDRQGVRGNASMRAFAERTVMPASPEADPQIWDLASPVTRVRPDAPPFFVIHGSYDSLAYVEDARLFVDALRETSKQPVVYAELPYAQHAFDVFHSVRTEHTINAVSRFLEWVHAGVAPPTPATSEIHSAS